MQHFGERRVDSAERFGEPTDHDDAQGELPLRLTPELWAALTSTQRLVYRRAAALIEVLEPEREVSVGELLSNGPGGEVLQALEVLEGMDLISVEPSDGGPLVKLLALPSDHIPITGPDGRRRWVFVAEPLDAPEVDPSQLN